MEKMIQANRKTSVLHAEYPISGSESITEKHRMFWKHFKSVGLPVQFLLILKAVVGWWLTFMPIYPFLGMAAYSLDSAGYKTCAMALVAPVAIPLFIAALPFALMGGITWLVLSYIPSKLGIGVIVSALYIVVLLFMVLRISVRNWSAWRCELLRTRSPWKTDRL